MTEATKTDIATLKNPPPREQNMPDVSAGFGNLQSFELLLRGAKMLSASTLIPIAYRSQKEIKEYGKVVGYEDNPNAIPNCAVALNMAQRMGADPLQVMQNLHIIEGRPSWSSQFIIAAINSCGRYSSLRFNLSKPDSPRKVSYVETLWIKDDRGKNQPKEVEKTVTVRDRECVAWALEKATAEKLESPLVSIEMAIAENWLTKKGSKWQTMPELMLMYRTGAFFGRIYAPELLMGLRTTEEEYDIIDMEPITPKLAPVNLDNLRAQAPVAQQEEATNTPPQRKPDSHPGPASETNSQAEPEVTYAHVANDLNRSKDIEVLDVAADLIGAVTDPQQRTELLALYNQRKAELSKPKTKPNLNVE